jgi:hypothetical protein
MASKTEKKLPIDDDLSLHKKGWVIQRVGWGLMFTFLILAAMGLFGEGPLSKRNVKSGGITLEYERFGRYEHGTMLRFESKNENIAKICIAEDYIKTFEINTIVPQPVKQVGSGGDLEFHFEGAENTAVTFYMMPTERRTVTGVIKANNDSFKIKQTIYP